MTDALQSESPQQVRERLSRAADDFPMSFDEACIYLGFGQTYLYELIRDKRIRSYQPTGRRHYIFKRDLDDFIRGTVDAEAS